MLAGRILGSRLGLALLLRCGMAAWLEAWAGSLPVKSSAQTSDVPCRIEPLPELPQVILQDERCAEVVRVLASMALGNILEASA